MIAADDRRFYFVVEDAAQTDRIVALASSSGEKLWELSLPSTVAGKAVGSATLIDDALVVGTTNGQVLAIDVESGQILWEIEMPEPVLAAPVFWGNLMLVPSADGLLRALELAN